MAIKQLSVFVENKQGKLVEITKMLAEGGINMRALSIAETRDFGILRLIVNDTEKACLILTEGGVVVKVTEVVAAELPHRPGSLNATLEVLDKAGINVEYLYAFLAKSDIGAYVVLRVADNEAAEKALSDAGYTIVDESFDLD